LINFSSSEPAALLDSELLHCADFSLTVAFAPFHTLSVEELSDESTCPHVRFPKTYNTISALSDV
jgi:hypothetical protein